MEKKRKRKEVSGVKWSRVSCPSFSCSSSAPPPSWGPQGRMCPRPWGQPASRVSPFSELTNNLWPDTCRLWGIWLLTRLSSKSSSLFQTTRKKFHGSNLPKNIVQAISCQPDPRVNYCSALDNIPLIIIYDSMYFRTLRAMYQYRRNLNSVNNKRKIPFYSQKQLYNSSCKF